MFKITKLFKWKDDTHKDNIMSTHQSLKDKYRYFQRLLEQNDKVLMLIADIEDKLKAEYLFDQQYIKISVDSISSGVAAIIDNLNSLSRGKYQGLSDRFTSIRLEIDKIISPRKDIPVSDYVIPLEQLSEDLSGIAGRKIARLGDMKTRLSLPVPDGFSITAYAFKRFLDHNKLTDKINELLPGLTISNMDEIGRFCNEIRTEIVKAELPPDLYNAISAAVARLKSADQRSPLMVSVRSSAIQEDGQVSFAGQYATFLNVPEDMVAMKYKEVIASIFRPRAVFYFKTKGFSEAEMVMSVGVIRMVDAKAGGVVYTKDPNDPDSGHMIINAAWGMGKSVVDGAVTPQAYVVSRTNREIIEKTLSEQRIMLVCNDIGDISEAPVPEVNKNSACLTDEQIKILSDHSLALEKHYGKPQDIEWAIDQQGALYVLQSRTLKTLTGGSRRSIPRRLEQYPILIDKGLIASKGIGYGRAFVVKEDADIKAFPEGGVLVASNMSADYVVLMDKAAAMVIDAGSITGHMASLAREYAIPTIVETRKATSSIQQGQEITVDAFNCNVYEGKIEELLQYKEQSSSFRDTYVFKTLERVFELIAPLNLVNPDSETFSPEHCKTFHDITRFSHEKAMTEMFSIGTDHDMDECHAVPLKAGIPIDAHLIDLGGGLQDNITKATPADIRSIPFSAFLKGMMNMRWPEPRPADVGGFLGMIAHTAAIPEQDLHETGEPSYAVISNNYMNFSIRLGYHFSAVEAYIGESIHDNYIKFHFKGGGATTDRRLRRIRLITEILKKIDFSVTVKDDVMSAVLPKFGFSDMIERLEIMGKLTAYTKQLDMAMYNDAVTDLFIEDFITDHVKK
jgi:pyruvate,water dikinase